jgi:HAD superfamily hydrolase (TIGR01509 family)
MAPAPGTVVFDVDGTLVDSNYQHVIAWFEAFRRHGHGVGAAELHRALGMGSDRLIEHVLGRDDDAVRRAHSNFYSPALENLCPFPRAAELLGKCAGHGLTVVLATSASAEEAERLTAAIGAGSAVAHVLTKADVDSTKPAPDLIRAALDAAGAAPDRAVMVGDSVWDVHAAARAGVHTVALRCGGFGEGELRDAGAIAVYDDPADLADHLDDSPIIQLVQEDS